jgi:hypothetical protein
LPPKTARRMSSPAAPHHSSEKRRVGECCFCFYCSAFFHLFPVRNHHSITESGASFFQCVLIHAFFSQIHLLIIIIKKNDKLSIGSVGSQGEKNSLNVAFGSALFCFHLS